MKRNNTWAAGLALLGLALVGAAPAAVPDDLVRQGNAAFERGDLETAVRLYTEAEARTTDPGLVAQNKAAALYRLGRHAEAEFYYRLCLQDAAGPRRARVLYGRGNALLQTAGTGNAKTLAEAVRCYEECLRQDDLEAELADNARHNLELAKLLWLKAKANPNDPNNPGASDQNPRPPDPSQNPGSGAPEPGPGDPRYGDRTPAKLDPGQQATPTNEQPLPGAGNPQPQPERGDVVPGSPEETADQLRQAAVRILQERRQYQQLSAKAPAEGVKNW